MPSTLRTALGTAVVVSLVLLYALSLSSADSVSSQPFAARPTLAVRATPPVIFHRQDESSTSPTSTSTSTSTTSTTSTTSSTTSTTSTTSSTTSTTSTTSTRTTSHSTDTSSTDTTTSTDSSTTGSGTQTSTSSSASSSTTSGADNSGKKPDGDGIKPSTIIGLSVAGGIAVVAIVAFLVWKVTRKKFSDFDEEAIKWPELNNDVHALPARRTGGAGIETSPTRKPAEMYGTDTATNSVADLHAPGDPYAVPPLPHHDPNQPYRDDPYGHGPAAAAPAGYYDPYRGPVPQTLTSPPPHHPQQWGMGGDGEAIPMSTYAASTRTRSPGPQYAYDAGRASPAPPMPPPGGRRSPGPQVAYGGPGVVDPRRPSPAPPYGMPPPQAGRRSPGPNAAYEHDAYGGMS